MNKEIKLIPSWVGYILLSLLTISLFVVIIQMTTQLENSIGSPNPCFKECNNLNFSFYKYEIGETIFNKNECWCFDNENKPINIGKIK